MMDKIIYIKINLYFLSKKILYYTPSLFHHLIYRYGKNAEEFLKKFRKKNTNNNVDNKNYDIHDPFI